MRQGMLGDFSMISRICIAIATLFTFFSIVGCERESTNDTKDLENAARKRVEQRTEGWALNVIPALSSEGHLRIRLENWTDDNADVYVPDGLFNLFVEARDPLKGRGHTITPSIMHPEIRTVKPTIGIDATFDFRSRLRLDSAVDGRFGCQVIYDDSSLHRENPSLKATSIGRVESDEFWVVIRNGRLTAIELE